MPVKPIMMKTNREEIPTINVNMDEPCPRCGELGAIMQDGEPGLCMKCAWKKIGFTPLEVDVLMKHKAIFADADAGLCPECKTNLAVNGGRCLQCVEERLRKGKIVSLEHLPERWPAGAHTVMMAKDIMAEHRPGVCGAAVAYLFKLKHGETNGKITLGTCAKQSPKNKLLHGWDYIIEIAWDMWALMTDTQREAILLHEICHIFKDDQKGVWKIEPHNVEEFVKVIEIHGLWKPDLLRFAQAIREAEAGDEKQQELFTQSA